MSDALQGNGPKASEAEAARAHARIGLLSFGGPAAQISVMHRILVEEKKWLTEPQFLHALNFCMLLPGPEAMQLATYAGWLMHGVRGGLVAGLLFILPGLVMMLALAGVFVLFGDVPAVAGLLYGVKAAVLAVVAEALVKVSKRALKSAAMVAVAVTAFVAIAFLKAPFPLIVIGAGLAGIALARVAPGALGAQQPGEAGDGVSPSPVRLRAALRCGSSRWGRWSRSSAAATCLPTRRCSSPRRPSSPSAAPTRCWPMSASRRSTTMDG